MSTESNARATSDREFVLEHTFRASAARVFRAYTDPQMIPLWWAQKGTSFRVDVMDVRPGGSWRFVQTMPNGQEVVFVGRYLEVRPVTRLVYTFAVEGQPGSELTAKVDLKESDGTTRLTLTNELASKEARDAMLTYGAAAGARVTWERLAEALAEEAR